MKEIAPLRAPGKLPEAIVRTLRRLIRRARLLIAVRGIGGVAALGVAALLLVMAVDAGVMIFSSRVRYALSLSALAVTTTGIVWLLVRPLARSFTLDGIARAIESQHPELQERVSSAVELLSSRESSDVRGSDALIAALVDEASHDVRGIRPGREITLRRARPALLIAVGLMAVLGSLLLAWPAKASRLLLRAVAPSMNLANVSAEDLSIVPGDVVVTRGQPLRITVGVAQKAVRSAEFRVLAADGAEATTPMKRVFDPADDTPRFTLTCPPAERSFRYRVYAGDALSRYYGVTVVPFPAVAGVDVRYDYPDYTHMEPQVEQDVEGDIAAVAGTAVTITVRTNTVVRKGELVLDGQSGQATAAESPAAPAAAEAELVPTKDGTTNCVFHVKLVAGLAGRWKAKFTDAYGFGNVPTGHDIKALPDLPPTVTILAPEDRQLRMTPRDRLPLSYAVADDFGLSGAELVLETDRGKLPAVAVALPSDGERSPQSAEGGAVLNLASLDLRGARQLTFRLRATDNLPAEATGPQQGFSEPYTIDLDLKAQGYAERSLLSWEERVRQSLEELLKELKAAKEESVKSQAEVAKPGDLTAPAQESLSRMLQHLDTADTSARDLARQVAWSHYGALAPRLTAVADNQITEAENLGGQVKLAPDVGERGRLADEADLQIDLAGAAVSDMLRKLDAMAEAARDELALQELAQEQRDLAQARQAMEQASPDQTAQLPMTPDEWLRQQNEVAANVDDALGRAIENASEGLHTRDLAAEARHLGQDQKDLGQDTRQLQSVQELDARLASLAQEQEKLAEDAAGDSLSTPPVNTMKEAAGDIRSEQLDRAVLEQGEAARFLGERASALQQEMRTGDIARKADGLAQQQKAVAQEVEQAKAAAAAGTPMKQEDQARIAASEQQLAKDAAALKDQARDAGWYTQNLLNQRSPAEALQQAAQAVQAGQPDKAAEAAARAADRARQLADELHKAAEGFGPVENKEQRTQRVADLAKRQNDIQARTRDAAAQRAQARQKLQETQMARLQREQAEVALGAADLAERTSEIAPQPDGVETEAAREAGSAARRLQEGLLPEAAERASEAGERMNDLADRLRRDTDSSPAGAEAGEERELADDTAQLARRQERLAQEMQDLARAQHQPLTASRQTGLAERTADLGDDAGRLHDALQQIAPQDRATADAASAAENLARAGRAQTSAEQAISGARTPEALPAQQESASALEDAARALDNVGRRLAEAAERDRGSPLAVAEASDSADLAQASQAAHEAANTQRAEAASRAAAHLSAAAERAGARAQRLGLRPSSDAARMAARPGYVTPRGGPRALRPAYGRGPSPAALQEMGITLEDWAKLPGELRDEILQGAGDDVPKEYRVLVKRYFEAVARQGAARPAGG